MKTYCYLVILLLAAYSSQAQPQWQWAKRDGSVNYVINPTYPRQVVAAANDKALWGSLQNRKAIYGQVAMGDYMLQELDSSGNTLASLYAGGRFALLQAQSDTAGNWYLLGTFYDSVVFNSSMRLGRDSFGNGAAYFLCRLHAGTLAPDWLTTIGSNTYCAATSMAVSGNGVYLPMDTSLATTYLKYNTATGARTTLWTQQGRSSTTYIQVDSGGNIYVAGNCVLNGPLNFNGTASVAPPSGKYPWYLARYRANGQLHWYQYLTDITCNMRGFKLSGNNTVYLSGMLADSTTLGGFHFSQPSTMFNADYLLARLDSNGSLVWAQQRTGATTLGRIYFGTQYHTAVLDSMLYLYCESQGPLTWGSGVSTNTVSNRHLATMIAFNAANGSAQWGKTVTGLYTLGHHVVSDGYSLWTTGNATDSSSIKFDTVSIPTVPGQYIPYIAKMKILSRKTTGSGSTNGVASAVSGHSARVYPNPAGGHIMVDGLTGDEAIMLRDVAGKALACKTQRGRNSMQLETGGLPRCIYFLQIDGSGGRQVVRVVLE